MANEAQVSYTLVINKGHLRHQTAQGTFRATVSGTFGPTPGAFLATTEGTDADLSALDVYGLCEVKNLDNTNFVDYGIWNGVDFYPLGRLLPGEGYPLRLSPNLGQEYQTGTGTTGAAVNTLRFKADTDDCVVYVGAFEA